MPKHIYTIDNFEDLSKNKLISAPFLICNIDIIILVDNGISKLCTLIDVGGVFTPKKVGCTVTAPLRCK